MEFQEHGNVLWTISNREMIGQLSNVTPEATETLINSLQEGKAVGFYSIPIKSLKMISLPISV